MSSNSAQLETISANLQPDPAGAVTPWAGPIQPTLELTPISRRPLKLPEATIQTVLAMQAPVAPTHEDIANSSGAGHKRVSIIVVTFNNLVFNKLCLESVLANTVHPDYEIIVVDNASSDTTPAYLDDLERRDPRVRVLYNKANRGFAAANNQGLEVATGDILVLLNNDTIVPPGWLATLARHLDDPSIGAVGPVTNRICNEAQIDAPYRTYGEFLHFARDYVEAHASERFDIRMLAMFCMAMRRDVYQRVGPIDERYEVGMLEDDDYSMSVRAAGYRVVCVEDAFVHHFSKASFGDLFQTGEYFALVDTNRRRWEAKWEVQWTPYKRRETPKYQSLVERFQEVIRRHLPPGATLIVVSKGDDALLDLEDYQTWHFPRNRDGAYAGFHSADSGTAIAHLEDLRAMGGQFLIFPSTAFWWLDHYAEFKQHLESRYHVTVDDDEVCLVFALSEPGMAR